MGPAIQNVLFVRVLSVLYCHCCAGVYDLVNAHSFIFYIHLMQYDASIHTFV